MRKIRFLFIIFSLVAVATCYKPLSDFLKIFIEQLFDILKTFKIFLKKSHNGFVNSLAILSNNTLASGSSDNTIKIWDTVNVNVI